MILDFTISTVPLKLEDFTTLIQAAFEAGHDVSFIRVTPEQSNALNKEAGIDVVTYLKGDADPARIKFGTVRIEVVR